MRPFASAFLNTDAGLIVLDGDGAVKQANGAALALLGCVSTAELVAAARPSGDPSLAGSALPENRLSSILAHRPQDGAATVELQSSAGPLAVKITAKAADGGTVLTLADVTAEWAAHRTLERAQVWIDETQSELGAYKSALEQHAIVAATDRGGRITYVNQRFCETSQYSRGELLGQKHSLVNSGHHPHEFFVEMWRTIGRGQRWHGEICNRAKDGSLYWVDTTIVPLRNGTGQIDGYISIRFEITEQKRAEAALHEEIKRRRDAESLLLDIIEAVPDAIAAFDQNDRLMLSNSAYADFHPQAADVIRKGAAFEEILRRGVENGQYVLPRDSEQGREAWIVARLRRHRNPGKPHIVQLSDGRWLQINERRSPAGYVVGVRTDITALKEAEQFIKSQAERDPLTGLLNRSVLADRLSRQVERSLQSGIPGVLIVADLDGFKDVNDTLGHDAGDEMLVQVAERIVEGLRAADTVVRLGGDEFAMVLPRMPDPRTIERIMARLYGLLQEPLNLRGRRLMPSASMGVCVFPRDGREPAELLKNADIALYQAKARGRGRHCYFSMHLRERLERREAVADDLRLALDQGDIDIALQPQFSVQSRALVGFEALARWRRHGEEVPPSQFIPVAEETGLVVALGYQVLDRALGEAARLLAEGLDPGVLAVNVAAAQLKLEEFPDTVMTTLRRHGLPASRLEIEVTETVLLDRSADRIARSLSTLSSMGISIALDDFGTGHASLAHLKRFPVDRLKIDRSFVHGIGTDEGDEVIVRTIVTLAHSLGKNVVAEGVETEAQLAFLGRLGCDVAQGYLVSEPLSARAAGALLRTHTEGPLLSPPGADVTGE